MLGALNDCPNPAHAGISDSSSQIPSAIATPFYKYHLVKDIVAERIAKHNYFFPSRV